MPKSMRVIDEETRKQVQQSRLDALEADNLFENLAMVEDEKEALEEFVLSSDEENLFKTEASKLAEKKKHVGPQQKQERRQTRREKSKDGKDAGAGGSALSGGSPEARGKKKLRGKLDLAKLFY